MAADTVPAPRLLLIGWDGATPPLLERFVSAGALPAMGRLMGTGSYRRLRSTIPPVTACAWSSFLTGRNPGRHGLFDFVTPRPGTYRFDYTNGGYRRECGGDLLRLLNEIGLRVGCVNLPMTYPPQPIDGFLISGLDAPDEKSGIAHPADLFEQVQRAVGAYRIDNRHLSSLRNDADRVEAIHEFKRIETRRTDVAMEMMRRCPVDVLVIVYNATDQVQHHFWHLMDPEHPAYPGADAPDVRAFGCAIEGVYRHCDAELARWLDACPDADVMVLSDHGAGPASGPRVRLNNALADAGLLQWTRTLGGVGSAVFSRIDAWMRRLLSARQKAALSRWLPRGRSAIESLGLPAIDWARTTAFAYEGFTLSPCVWINRADRFPQGIVHAGSEYDRACARVVDALKQLTDPRTGRPVIPRVLHRDELYDGPHTQAAPDLILDWWTETTFTITRSDPNRGGGRAVFYPPPVAVPGRDITGIHRRDGILVAAGPRLVNSGRPPRAADLTDIAPTALALLGAPIPPDMDGRVIDDMIVRRDSVATPPAVRPHDGRQGGDTHASAQGQTATTQRAAEPPAADGAATGYSDRERAIIEERLSGLGYIE